jgi:NAD(P)-dependent dehydrogenase (short-subunit alcohol dehydrogenase family)
MNTPVVLITCALTSFGRATTLAFARRRARIVISGGRNEAGQELAAELRSLGAEAEYWPAEVRHEDG